MSPGVGSGAHVKQDFANRADVAVIAFKTGAGDLNAADKFLIKRSDEGQINGGYSGVFKRTGRAIGTQQHQG